MVRRRVPCSLLGSFLAVLGARALGSSTTAQIGTVESEQKISATAGGFEGVLDSADRFGRSVASLGDLDGDGVGDLAVGAYLDNDGGTRQGAVWILFLNTDGTVESEQKISATAGGFEGALTQNDFFGVSIASLGDLDGDGVVDLAVGAEGDDDSVPGQVSDSQGSVWILFLNTDGTVESEQKISATAGGFVGPLDQGDSFGQAVSTVGDLDGDGVIDLAVGAEGDDDGGSDQISEMGAVWILFLNTDGTVKAEQKISATAGGFGGSLDQRDVFGFSIASLGDLDGDGLLEVAVGAPGDDDGSVDQGAVWMLSLRADGTVDSEKKISETSGGFGGVLELNDRFGMSLACLGDIDGSGIPDLAVGVPFEDEPFAFDFANQGAVWILFLDADGMVASEQKISEISGGFGGDLHAFDEFGISVAFPGDLDGDGAAELAVGAYKDDDGGTRNNERGAVWILFLEGPPCFTLDFETEDDFVTPLGNGQALSTPPEFGELVRITSAGANAGPAIFDSTPGGPNDPALNEDMLIGRGNLLLLQNDWYAFPQTVPGFYDVVTDDPDGGDLIFDFTSPVEPRSLSLADINPPPNQGASVTLFDEADRTRVYAVEPGWTGDYGDAGPHLLDLATLAPQPGNGTPRFATAAEDAGFDAGDVVKVVVHLTGPGAIDDLSFCIPDPQLASVTERNGSGVNPTILRSDSRPALGETWNATLDCAGMENGVAVLELRRLATSGTLTPYGEVLVEGALLHRASRVYTGSPSRLVWRVPHDMSLLGLEVHVQGFCRDRSAISRKARAARIVLSNALDLVLGF